MTNAKVGVRGSRLGQRACLRRAFGRCFKTQPRCLDLRISLKHRCNKFSRAQWPLLRLHRQRKRQQAEIAPAQCRRHTNLLNGYWKITTETTCLKAHVAWWIKSGVAN